jgi:SulP family sulfate permease
VVVDLSSSFRLSVPAIDTLAELHDELRRRGVALWVARVRSAASPMLEASGFAATLGPERLHATVDGAVDAFTGVGRPPPRRGPE